MKLLATIGLLALIATGTMASKCELNVPQNTDTSTTP
jgi:hypothetical protein